MVDQVFDLFAELKATDAQMDFQVVYASGVNGVAGLDPEKLSDNLVPLFDEILQIPKATVDPTQPLQLLIANVDYDDFKGKMGIGRVVNGVLKAGDDIVYGKPDEVLKKGKIAELFVFNNIGREKVDSARAGDIVVVTGLPDIAIGETVMDKEKPVYLPPIAVEEPTVRMTVGVNKVQYPLLILYSYYRLVYECFFVVSKCVFLPNLPIILSPHWVARKASYCRRG